MENQHVTSFSNNNEEEYGMGHENADAGSYSIDPSLDRLDPWTGGPQSHQYSQPAYAVPQYGYQPSYGQQPAQQQNAFQQNYPGIGQPESYSYQPAPNQYSQQFFTGQSTHNNFGRGYLDDYSAQSSQHETISPQALQVENRIGGGSVAQNPFHHGDLGQRQAFQGNPQQDPWGRTAVDSGYPDLINGHAVSNQTPSTKKPSQGSTAYPTSYTSSAVNHRGGAVNPGYDSGLVLGQQSIAATRKTNVPASNPLRVTDQDLLDRYPSQNDVAHRVVNLPFVVLSETVTSIEVRGKTTIPKYHPRPNSIGKQFARRVELFATRSAPVTVKKPRVPSIKKASKKSKVLTNKAITSKDFKARMGSTQISVKPGSPATPSSLESSPSESSEEESEEEESEEEEEMADYVYWSSVRSQMRPTNDIAAAAQYDAVSLVFKEGIQHGPITRDEVIKAVTAYEPFIVKLRDNYRSSVTALADATTQKRLVLIPRLTQAKSTNYQALTNALKVTLEHGHSDIIKNLGTNQKIAAGLWTVLTDFVKAGDYASELPLVVLELMAKFSGMTPELLRQLKFESIQKRILKKGTDKMKELIAVISKHVFGRELESDPLSLPKAMSQTPRESTPSKTTATARTTGIKRPHEGEDNSNPAKKFAPGTKSIAAPRQPSTASKPAPQPNLFASLTRSSKPAQSTNGIIKPPAKIATPKAAAKAAPSTSTPRISNISALLDEVNNPKAPPQAPVVPEGPPETPEEKKKRERKESRRHLRVKWREGEELTQVKIFAQVEGEDDGRKDEMVRDAHDYRSEGMMHKQRAQEEVSVDEDEAAGEIEYRPYPALISVDFSVIDERQRSRNYTTRGGLQNFSTRQQEIQSRHESIELMVVYADPADIPHSAKEPPISNEERVREEKILGRSTEQWFYQRMDEVLKFGEKGARQLASSRLPPPQTRGFGYAPFQNNSNPVTTQQNHQQFTSQNQNQNFGHATPSYTTPAMPSSNTNGNTKKPLSPAELEVLVASIRATIHPILGKAFPAKEAPSYMNDRQQAVWLEGYNRDQASKAANSAPPPNQAGAVQQPQFPQAAMQQPQTQSYQQPPQASSAPVQQAVDIVALMRQITAAQIHPHGQQQLQQQQQAQQQQQTQQQTSPQTTAFDWSAYLQNANLPSALTQAAAQQPQQNWPGQHGNDYNFGGSSAANAMYNGVAANGYAAAANPQGASHNPGWGGMPGAANNWGTGASAGDPMQWEYTNGNNGNANGNRQHNPNMRGGGNYRDEVRGGNNITSKEQRISDESGLNRKMKGYKANTKVCRFFLENKCAKGEHCTYLHPTDLHPST